MKSLLLLVFLVASAICASAQKVYFIYLQSDNYNPFYLKMNDRIFSSATSGYLILSNLVDSTYNFSIGFPSSQPESRFTITLSGKDRGYLIKNFDSGLGLFDLQNLTITNAQKDESVKNISYQKRSDDFSYLLSKAANDTSLLYAIVREKEDVAIQKEQIQEEASRIVLPQDSLVPKPLQTNVASEIKKLDTTSITEANSNLKKRDTIFNTTAEEGLEKDTTALLKPKEQFKEILTDKTIDGEVDTSARKADTKISANTTEEVVFKRSQIKKHSESSTMEGFGLVYYDNYEGEMDTIRLLIPNPPVILKQITEADSSEAQKGFIHVEDLKKDTVQKTPVIVAVKNNVVVKSQCKSVASNNDFFKLRKNMAGANTDEAMVAEAKKIFKSKCFTTEQIKNLSALFLTSAGKYLFFDAAYLHVSDQQQFSSLESEIKDDYYLKRFKALVSE